MKKKLCILFFILFFIPHHEIAYAENVKIEGGEIVNGRTFVPFRAIFEQFGANVVWNQTTKTITATKDNHTINLKIGSKNAQVDGKKITIDVAPYIKDGRTFVPLRFISESLGAEIDWDPNSRVATVVLENKVIQVGTYQWKTYFNDRFGFSIDYPSYWGLFPPSANNDGIVFDSGIAGADFRVYGSYSNMVAPEFFGEIYRWYFYPERYNGNGLETKVVRLAAGNEAVVLIDRTTADVIYHMLIVKDEMDYHFEASVPKNFNEDLIWKMIESFRIL